LSELSRILQQVEAGDPLAAEQLLPLVYHELRRLASQLMANERAQHTLQATALVHEAFLRLMGNPGDYTWQNSRHFYGAAAEAMRRILIEAARRKASLKRGGDRKRIDLEDEHAKPDETDWAGLLALDEALKKLEIEDPDSYRLVMLRYFGGLTVEQAAEAMEISPRTAKRYWSYARAWLHREIDGVSSPVLPEE
jgi:RNA polymerase sigma factor (TIGR02999 family)